MSHIDCYNADVLLDRLTDGVTRSGRPVTFVVGSAFSAPPSADLPGVPNADGIVNLIREEFKGQQLEELNRELSSHPQAYQAAFHFLQGRRGQEVANQIIKRAVWEARRPTIQGGNAPLFAPTSETSDDVCRFLDKDIGGWFFSPAHEALGALVTAVPKSFGKSVLTTNFDPLIEASIQRAGGSYFRTVLHRDGDLGQTQGEGCHVIHLHGYWHGSDTLHTPRQLGQSRPRLRTSLSHLVSGHTIVICGYGGWDDVFTQTLMQLVLDDHSSPEIVWTFREKQPDIPDRLVKLLSPAIDRGRAALYEGVNCHDFVPRLANAWMGEEFEKLRDNWKQKLLVPCRDIEASEDKIITTTAGNHGPHRKINFNRGEQDHPPKVEFYVGRSNELTVLKGTSARVLYLTGIGGQGKSALAAHYFSSMQSRAC